MSAVTTFSLDLDREYAPPAVQEVCCDKAREFVSTCRNVGIKVEHSTPGMPRTNAIAESRVTGDSCCIETGRLGGMVLALCSSPFLLRKEYSDGGG